MPLSPGKTAALRVSSSAVASPLLNDTAVTLVAVAVPETPNALLSGAAVVSSAASNVSVSVTPFTDAAASTGAVCSVRGVSLTTARSLKSATSMSMPEALLSTLSLPVVGFA